MLVFSKPCFFDFLNYRNLEVGLFIFTRTISTFQIIGHSLMYLSFSFSCSSWFIGYLRLHVGVFKASFFLHESRLLRCRTLTRARGSLSYCTAYTKPSSSLFFPKYYCFTRPSFFIKVSNQIQVVTILIFDNFFSYPYLSST